MEGFRETQTKILVGTLNVNTECIHNITFFKKTYFHSYIFITITSDKT